MSTYTPDEMLVVLGFTVEITGAGSGTDSDSAWETVSGGALDYADGKVSVGEVTLRGPLTGGRAWIGKALEQVAKGEHPRLKMTITELVRGRRRGRTFEYFDCFPTRYICPKALEISARSKEQLYEEVTLQPGRLVFGDGDGKPPEA